ncbi:hypothetical protein LWF15_30010 [Kineosporia rhizophila]|uniref:hypothetical protein n=1 Tax=Kineosporia TaxID=49184 RepID=UPI000A8CD018|nr:MULTISPECIES: hypothetical protein [Kineosporia]MCE0539743.1 hypothetical protein [Kineosporia rhizophila]GLY16361.1 hypothetical protein Kisp01_33760 [Kineosporia sp. NBRC 101677]
MIPRTNRLTATLGVACLTTAGLIPIALAGSAQAATTWALAEVETHDGKDTRFG